jgi:lipid-binding SYLF domain-containing protein
MNLKSESPAQLQRRIEFMPEDETARSRGPIRKHQLVASILIMFFILPAGAADKSKDEQTLNNAATVLQKMTDSQNVPADVLARANCIVILPDVKKFGFAIGGSGGRGPMICRKGKNFSGMWSTPAMYTIGGASFGLQIGGSSTDFVLLIMSQKGVDAVLNGRTKLGNEATAAAGPSGATHVGTVGGSDILTYADASGLFAGTSLGAATLEPDQDANQRLYDKGLTAKEIVIGNSVKPTAAGKQLMTLLNTKVAKHSS